MSRRIDSVYIEKRSRGGEAEEGLVAGSGRGEGGRVVVVGKEEREGGGGGEGERI